MGGKLTREIQNRKVRERQQQSESVLINSCIILMQCRISFILIAPIHRFIGKYNSSYFSSIITLRQTQQSTINNVDIYNHIPSTVNHTEQKHDALFLHSTCRFLQKPMSCIKKVYILHYFLLLVVALRVLAVRPHTGRPPGLCPKLPILLGQPTPRDRR